MRRRLVGDADPEFDRVAGRAVRRGIPGEAVGCAGQGGSDVAVARFGVQCVQLRFRLDQELTTFRKKTAMAGIGRGQRLNRRQTIGQGMDLRFADWHHTGPGLPACGGSDLSPVRPRRYAPCSALLPRSAMSCRRARQQGPEPPHPAVAPALERQAEWTHRLRMHERERITLRKIIHILEDSRGKKDLSLIPPLTGLGNSYLFVSDFELENFGGAAISSGDAYLKRAVRISEDNPESDWQVQRRTLLSLADFYTLSDRSSKAGKVYREIWKLLSVDAEREGSRFTALETTHILQKIHPPKYYNSQRTDSDTNAPEAFENRKIVVAYSVSSRGDTGNIRVVEVEPAGLEEMEYAVTREMRRLIHRPRMADGVAVDTHDKTYTHEFFYRPSDVPVAAPVEADQAVAAEEN